MNAEELFRRLQRMSSADKLRLAAGLLDHNDIEMASLVVEAVNQELARIKLASGRKVKP